MRHLARIAAELLITAGVLVVGFLAYMYWGTALRTHTAQRAFARELSAEWSAPNQVAAITSPAGPEPGKPFALLRIPQFGPGWQFAVVQGTSAAQLALGPGHVPGTALPGQVGNFVVAGHRITSGNPFWNLPALRKGAEIDVETVSGRYEYRVTGGPVGVPASDLAVLAPVPFQPGKPASRRMITLVTCDSPWTGTSRVVVIGVLVRALPRLQGG